MTHISKVIILAGSLLVAGTAIAANWVKVIDDNNSRVYVDTDSIKVNGSVVTHWEKYEYQKTQVIENFKPYKSILMYTHIDCKEKTWGFTSIIFYDQKGQVVSSGSIPLDIKPIPPDTRIEYISYVMCLPYQSNQSK